MKDVKHACSMTESNIEHIVFTAARANEMRLPKFNVFGYNVRFVYIDCGSNEHKATVYDTNGFEVGFAIVDAFDI
jgi:hypothetical protein